jgi:hypothetical protein
MPKMIIQNALTSDHFIQQEKLPLLAQRSEPERNQSHLFALAQVNR